RRAVPGPGRGAADRRGRVQRPDARRGAPHRPGAGRGERGPGGKGGRAPAGHAGARAAHQDRGDRGRDGRDRPDPARADRAAGGAGGGGGGGGRGPPRRGGGGGGGGREPYPKPPAYDRERLLRRLMVEGTSVRDGNRVVALASPRPGVLGVLALMDTGRRAAGPDLMALGYAATGLAVELAPLRAPADSELRGGRELRQGLLPGTGDARARPPPPALG